MCKKLISLIFFSLFCFPLCFAQAPERNSRFEVAAAFGGAGRPLGAVGVKTTGTVSLDFFYTPVKWVSIGVGFGIHDFIKVGSTGDTGTASRHLHPNLMIYLRGNWYTGKRWRIYSLVGYPDIALYDRSYSAWSGFQVTPIGVSFGSRVYGFAEIGTGYMYTPGRFGLGVRF